MSFTETSVVFNCKGDLLVGVLAMPEQPTGTTGVVVVVGGPQYRVGSHRQFVSLSRALANVGLSCLRFDYRGMGDSQGESRSFSEIGDDIRAAIDCIMIRNPHVKSVVLWGLCDGASAAVLNSATDPRVSGFVLLNPWVRTAQSEARVYLKHYYLRRIVSASFWSHLISGRFRPRAAISDLLKKIRKTFSGRQPRTRQDSVAINLPRMMLRELQTTQAEVLILLSGNDFVAREFQALVDNDSEWNTVVSHATVIDVPGADHTFSDPDASQRVERYTIEWIITHHRA